MSSSAALVAPAIIGSKIHKKFPRDKGEASEGTRERFLRSPARSAYSVGWPRRAGKTTLMRLAAGLMTADAGVLSVLGIELPLIPSRFRTALVTCLRDSGCTQISSVQENLDLYADLHGSYLPSGASFIRS